MANSTIKAPYPMFSVSGYQTDITGYNSENNQFTCPYNGYILASVWDGDTQTVWFNGKNISIELNSTNPTFMMYAAHGTKWWVNGNGNNRFVRFAALLQNQS